MQGFGSFTSQASVDAQSSQGDPSVLNTDGEVEEDAGVLSEAGVSGAGVDFLLDLVPVGGQPAPLHSGGAVPAVGFRVMGGTLLGVVLDTPFPAPPLPGAVGGGACRAGAGPGSSSPAWLSTPPEVPSPPAPPLPVPMARARGGNAVPQAASLSAPRSLPMPGEGRPVMAPLQSTAGLRVLPGPAPAAGFPARATAASTAGLPTSMGSAGAGGAPAAAGPPPPPLPPVDTGATACEGTAAREDTAVFIFGVNGDAAGGTPVVS